MWEYRSAVVQSHAVRELLSDDGGVHGGTLEHRHHNRGDGATPIGLELPFHDAEVSRMARTRASRTTK